MRILLTGPGGSLGSALARHWFGRGHELSLLARPASRLKRLADLSASLNVIRVSQTEEAAAAVREAMPDAIVHTACCYGRNGESALELIDTNIRLGIALLQAVLDFKRTKDVPPTFFMNTATVLSPDVSLYALSKRQFSDWGASLASSAPSMVKFLDIRLQQMYGPFGSESSFVTHVIEACRQNLPRLGLTEGEQLRDFIHIDDVVLAFDCILEKRDQFAASDIIDVGSGVPVTMRRFVEMTKQITGADTVMNFGAVPYRADEAMLCVADTNRLRKLGWHPTFSLAEGLKSLIYELR